MSNSKLLVGVFIVTLLFTCENNNITTGKIKNITDCLKESSLAKKKSKGKSVYCIGRSCDSLEIVVDDTFNCGAEYSIGKVDINEEKISVVLKTGDMQTRCVCPRRINFVIYSPTPCIKDISKITIDGFEYSIVDSTKF